MGCSVDTKRLPEDTGKGVKVMDFVFCIEKELAVLSGSDSGHSVRVTYTSFNNYPTKLDIRRWNDGHPLKGIQLTDDEARKLCKTLIDAGYKPED